MNAADLGAPQVERGAPWVNELGLLTFNLAVDCRFEQPHRPFRSEAFAQKNVADFCVFKVERPASWINELAAVTQDRRAHRGIDKRCLAICTKAFAEENRITDFGQFNVDGHPIVAEKLAIATGEASTDCRPIKRYDSLCEAILHQENVSIYIQTCSH